jgi:hypothetical protein
MNTGLRVGRFTVLKEQLANEPWHGDSPGGVKMVEKSHMYNLKVLTPTF